MTAVVCLESLLVRLALAYWAVSSLVLIFRLVWPDFQALAAYGGHSVAAPHASASVRKGKRTVPSARAGHCASLLWLLSWPMRALRASPLGTVTVARKHAFLAFYTTGVAACSLLLVARVVHGTQAAASAKAMFLTSVPLLLFTLHCAVRLAETRLVQRFRVDDEVTLFAAVAGSTFYAVAAVSSTVPSAVTAGFSSRWLEHSTDLQLLFAAGAAAHLSFQAVQVMVHTILAKLRAASAEGRHPPSSRTAASSDAAVEHRVWEAVQRGLLCRFTAGPQRSHTNNTISTPTNNNSSGSSSSGLLSYSGAWRSYRFPYHCNPVFQLVLDPHYTCEVLLYAVNASLVLLCLVPDPRLPSALHHADEVRSRVWASVATLFYVGEVCADLSPWVSLLASGGVALFTLANLSITAAGHRRFWEACNLTRREVGRELSRIASSSVTPDVLDGTKADVVRVAERMLSCDVVEESLPRWNVLPFVW